MNTTPTRPTGAAEAAAVAPLARTARTASAVRTPCRLMRTAGTVPSASRPSAPRHLAECTTPQGRGTPGRHVSSRRALRPVVVRRWAEQARELADPPPTTHYPQPRCASRTAHHAPLNVCPAHMQLPRRQLQLIGVSVVVPPLAKRTRKVIDVAPAATRRLHQRRHVGARRRLEGGRDEDRAGVHREGVQHQRRRPLHVEGAERDGFPKTPAESMAISSVAPWIVAPFGQR